jgi:hypothetical protein
MGHAMTTTARRVIPLRDALRRNAKPRAKKPTASFPTADQIAQVITRLQMLISVGEAEKVDAELKHLLLSLGLNAADPDAWRDGFLMLAALHHDVGRPRRNLNAAKLSTDENWVLLMEVIRLKDQGLTQGQAIEKLAGDRSKTRLFKFTPMSSIGQRAEVLRQRLKKIINSQLGWDALMGNPSVTTVEKALINLAIGEVKK